MRLDNCEGFGLKILELIQQIQELEKFAEKLSDKLDSKEDKLNKRCGQIERDVYDINRDIRNLSQLFGEVDTLKLEKATKDALFTFSLECKEMYISRREFMLLQEDVQYDEKDNIKQFKKIEEDKEKIHKLIQQCQTKEHKIEGGLNDFIDRSNKEKMLY